MGEVSDESKEFCSPIVETAMKVGMLGLLWLKVVTLQL